jgi:hypothetical protein
MAGKQPADEKGNDDKAKIREARVRFVDRYRGLLFALQSCRQLGWNIQTDNLSNAHAAQAVGTKSGATAGPNEAYPDVNELGGSFRLQSDLPKAQLLEVCGKLRKEILQPGGRNPDGSMAHRLLTTVDVFPKNDLYHDTKLLQEGPRMIFRGSTVAQCISRGI